MLYKAACPTCFRLYLPAYAIESGDGGLLGHSYYCPVCKKEWRKMIGGN